MRLAELGIERRGRGRCGRGESRARPRAAPGRQRSRVDTKMFACAIILLDAASISDRDDLPSSFHARRGHRTAATGQQQGDNHAARRHPSRHLHHRRRTRERRLLHPRARPADGQEDGQPGRPDGLPPVLRRRGGKPRRRHHVLRVPRRPTRPRRRGHGAHDHVPRRLGGGARFLGVAPRRRGDSDPAGRRPRSASRTPKGSGSSSPSSRRRMRRSSRGIPRSRPSSRSRASTPSGPSATAPEASRALLEGTLGFVPAGDALLGGAAAPCAAGATPTTRRPPRGPACRGPEPCTTWPGPRTWTSRRRGSLRCAARARTRAASSTASGSARSTSASRAASCSRSRRSGPASRSTRTPTTSARRSSCRRPSSTCATQIEPVLTPLPDPRAAWARS